MRAVMCKAYGPPDALVVADVEGPTPGRGQVVVTVKACGVNFPDTLIIRGLYQFKPALPFSPGNEVAGIVKTVGEGVDTVKPGDRVIAFGAFGGFAEEMLAEVGALIPMPAAMDFETAASVVMTYGTGLHALKDRAHLRRAKRCWCWALQAASAWRPSRSARPWAHESSPPPPAPRSWRSAVSTARTRSSTTQRRFEGRITALTGVRAST